MESISSLEARDTPWLWVGDFNKILDNQIRKEDIYVVLADRFMTGQAMNVLRLPQ